MRAVAIRRGETSPTVVEKPRPEPATGEALVRTLRVGVDGTDREVIDGTHGGYPEGDDHLVLGHEAVGVVEDPNGTSFEVGDVVVPTVRRRPEGRTNDYFERGQADMAPPDQCLERGISGAHGFMSDYFTSPEETLVPIPEHLAPLGFLVEPISITEKALHHAYVSRSAFDWRPESALVLGNGPLGLLTLAMLDDYERTYCLGRRDRPDPSIDIIERLGATYVDSRRTPVAEVPESHETVDLVFEATGYARHAFDGIHALAPGGVAALLGVPESWSFEVDGGSFHKDVVMNNKAIVGSVNSGAAHFESAVDTLTDLPDWFVDEFVSGVYHLDDAPDAFVADDAVLKTAVQFDTY
ncbi:glucose 1-dehydrogenase [Halomarina oriensis]|uniref:Glucose 1-dehydrogenase n=1 Tax=Halomarina oriensis TaxID=671145 RepID=A0A6B0GUJ0_9EURY|nr:glucose 1-dehydrogenase [Halomarina oriensis]MWG36253.1 alcohol dehydrogenase catalytic domain-containing protein [Halomarina oriensis]